MNKTFGSNSLKESTNRKHENTSSSNSNGGSNIRFDLEPAAADGDSAPVGGSPKKARRDVATTASQIGDLYEFGVTIGRGHFATVKSARHIFTGERVAIKVIDKTKLDDISRDHLFQEVKCMKLVQHPNVVRLYDVIDSPTKFYLVLEFGDGGDMYDYIMKHPNGLTEPKARNYFGQIVDAIKYCHDLHVVHRDLKPENVVFFEQTGQVKLTDFGFSNVFEPGAKLFTSCGSLAYSAPEILLGDSYDAPPVDIWSLGVILYMLVTGRAPFQEANDSETLTMILDCKFYLPGHLSDDCVNLISNMLVRDPKGRIKLDNILKHDWFAGVAFKSREAPLALREQLSEKETQEVVQSMIAGNVAEKKEILDALQRDEYNYITATYYLIAERILRKRYTEKYRKTAEFQAKTSKSLVSTDSIPQFYEPVPDESDEPEPTENVATTTTTTVNSHKKFSSRKDKDSSGSSGGGSGGGSTLNAASSLEYATTNMSVALLTNIEEDEENPAEEFDYFEPDKNKPILKNGSNKLPGGAAALNSRRPSRGHELNTVTGLTILEEIETENSTPNSLKNSLMQFKELEVEQIIVAEKSERNGSLSNVGINYGSEDYGDDAKKELISSSSNSESNDLKSKRLNLSKMSVGANGICFDSGENEFGGPVANELSVGREYNWTRTASATSSKSHQIRSEFARHSGKKGGTSSLSAASAESRKHQTKEGGQLRPVSMSSDSYDDSNNLMIKDRITVARTKSLVENSTLPGGVGGGGGGGGTVAPFESYPTNSLSAKKGSQTISYSNSHDHLPASFYEKTLSAEHRLANMSQLSISSQLSKNNSFRVHNRAGVCDTPIQHQHSATPTPRESTVFNRGDRNPYAKILSQSLQSAKLQQLQSEQKAAESSGGVDYLEEKFDFKDGAEIKSTQASYKNKSKRSTLNTFNELENENDEEQRSKASDSRLGPRLQATSGDRSSREKDEEEKQLVKGTPQGRKKESSPVDGSAKTNLVSGDSSKPLEAAAAKSSGRRNEKRSPAPSDALKKKALEENYSASSEDPHMSDLQSASKPLSSKKELKHMGSSNSKHSYTKENASRKFSSMGCSKCCVVI